MKIILTSVNAYTNDNLIKQYPKLLELNPEFIHVEPECNWNYELEYLIVEIDTIERLFDIFPTWVLYQKFEPLEHVYTLAIPHALLKDGYIE